MLISIEGMDGVGKTTAARSVASNLNIPVIEKPIKRLMFLDNEQSKKVTESLYSNYSTDMQALYYLLGFLSV